MASQGQDNITENSRDIGQAQLIRDEYANHASNISQQVDASNQSAQDKAANFLRQTGEQMKSMAQGAANAMKNTLGLMNTTDNSSNTNSSLPINDPSYPSHPSNPTNPTNNRI